MGTAIAVCFSPEEYCTTFAVDAIDRAEQQILVHAYGLTTSSESVEALVRAKQRGVDVRLIADRTTRHHASEKAASSCWPTREYRYGSITPFVSPTQNPW